MRYCTQPSVNVAGLYDLQGIREPNSSALIKQNGPATSLDRSIDLKETTLRNLFRVKASGEVEVPGLLILALIALLAVLAAGIFFLLK